MDFQAVQEQYSTEHPFCDLLLVGATFNEDVLSSASIKCHRLVLASAIPPLRAILLSEGCPTGEDGIQTVVLADVSHDDVRDTVSSVYETLVTSGDNIRSQEWCSALGLEVGANPSILSVKPVPSKRPHVKETERRCTECGALLPFATNSEKRSYQQHLSDHFKCDCVNLTFGDKKAYKLHMRTAHRKKPATSFTNKSLIPCPHCKARLTTQKFLDKHIETVHNHNRTLQSNLLQECSKCLKKFNSKQSMTEHARNMHAPLSCKHCGQRLFGNLALLKHQRESHVAPAICEVCGRHFKHKKYLRDHVVRSHLPDDQKPFKCRVCSRGFLNQIQLDDHVARHHEGRRPYACRSQGCGRCFTLSGTRKRHEKRDHNLHIDLKRGMRSKSEVLNHSAAVMMMGKVPHVIDQILSPITSNPDVIPPPPVAVQHQPTHLLEHFVSLDNNPNTQEQGTNAQIQISKLHFPP